MSNTIAILISVLLIIGAASALFIYWGVVYRPHPRIRGALRVTGLQDRVEVLRDRWGVPHIYAQSEEDLWFAQGYVQAQDRLWQLEQFRRMAAGRLSEVMGEEALELDKLARVVGFRRAAEKQLDYMDDPVRMMLERYAQGVNAFLAQNRNRLPLEFTVLGFAPEPWTPVDSLSIGMLIGWALSKNWLEELVRVGLYTHLGPERAAELLPDMPVENPTILPDQGQALAELSRVLLQSYHAMQDYIGLTAPGLGSNNWVVSGSKTISGKPLLANDPHLSVTMPGLWYMQHLEARTSCDGGPLRVIGAGIPGGPGIQVGHNEDIAWGATAAQADIVDLYVEQSHPQDATRFRFGDDWEQAEVIEERIEVRGREAPETVQVLITRHGPILNALLSEREQRYPPLALRWTAYEPGCNFDAIWGLVRARNWEQFRRAVGKTVVPTLSYVYADREGNIGFMAAGRVPIRQAGCGLVPAPGYSGTHEWVGFIPWEELPQSYNPENGVLFTANNRMAGKDYPYWWGVDHAPGYRARRIQEMLNARPRFSLRDFQEMQLDVFDYLGQTIAPYFTLVDPKDAWERRAQKALVEWNYRRDNDSVAALVFEVTLIHLLDLVFGDKLGPFGDEYKGVPRWKELGSAFSYQAAVKLAELLQNEESWWFGQGMTGEPRTREALLALALTRAVQTLKEEIGDDARRWQWGRLHQVIWRHPLGGLRLFRGMLNRGPFPVPGSPFTINAHHLDHAFPLQTITAAPIFRMVVDLANWDRSTFITCPGQSGLPGHPFYDNLMHIWLEGEMVPMRFSREKVEESDPLYHLELIPIAEGR
ncbi:MAG: penicillin acylase family protein [Chloroflexi bacterium]|nr:penicillin acylase family protein [Chloroflexota bacterium]